MAFFLSQKLFVAYFAAAKGAAKCVATCATGFNSIHSTNKYGTHFAVIHFDSPFFTL